MENDFLYRILASYPINKMIQWIVRKKQFNGQKMALIW